MIHTASQSKFWTFCFISLLRYSPLSQLLQQQDSALLLPLMENLTEAESRILEIPTPDAPESQGFVLVARIHSGRRVNNNIALKMLLKLWKFVEEVQGQEWSGKLLLFKFKEKDLIRILKGSPWHFDNMPVCMQRIQGSEHPTTITCFHFEIWGQIYDLSLDDRAGCTRLCRKNGVFCLGGQRHAGGARGVPQGPCGFGHPKPYISRSPGEYIGNSPMGTLQI